MELGEECRRCLYNSQSKRVEKYADKNKVSKFNERILMLTNSFPSNKASPLMMKEIDEVHREIFGTYLDYHEEKKRFNSICLQYEDKIQKIIDESDEPLKESIRFARVGNLIDFAKLTEISNDLLQYFIDLASSQTVDEAVYHQLLNDLSKAHTCSYLLDNCGEIVFDKLMIKTLLELFPSLKITAVVRGEDVINDVTREDAHMVRLDGIVDIEDNGTHIPGTYLPCLKQECRDLLENADIIISKGLGNFETLYGCGLNVYYMFLCKCNYFADKFNLPLWSSVIVKERFKKRD